VFSDEQRHLATHIITTCRQKGMRLATAESCTGGLIAACLTAIPGASQVVDRGLVTYANTAKTDLLGVPEELLAAEGAVCEPVARAMAEGAARRSGVQLAVSVTGIAGPTGGTPEKPVGLVHLAAARVDDAAGPASVLAERHVFAGNRDAIRMASVSAALALLSRLAEPSPDGSE